ncbi:MAG TPA: hypothetical protein VFG51_00220 [Candidatus Saccharimonadia bacterium]|nr:hypothetical protein [Candidatus Saccharimonadia bacterium]
MTSHKDRHIIEHGGRALPELQQLFDQCPHGVIFFLTTIPNKHGGIGGAGLTSTTEEVALYFGINKSEIISAGNLTRAFAIQYAYDTNRELYDQEGGAPTDKILEYYNNNCPDRTKRDQAMDEMIAALALQKIAQQKGHGVESPIVIVEGKAVALLMEHMINELTKNIPAMVFIGLVAREETAVERKQAYDAELLRAKGVPEAEIPGIPEVQMKRRERQETTGRLLHEAHPKLIKKKTYSYKGVRKNLHYVWNSTNISQRGITKRGMAKINKDLPGFLPKITLPHGTNGKRPKGYSDPIGTDGQNRPIFAK